VCSLHDQPTPRIEKKSREREREEERESSSRADQVPGSHGALKEEAVSPSI